MNSYIRLALDEIFGPDNHLNQIQWHYKRWPTPAKEWQKMHNTIIAYTKSKGDHVFNRAYGERTEETQKRWGTSKIVAAHDQSGKRVPSDYAGDDSVGAPLDDVWDISIIAPSAHERLDYPTQKPEALLKRIIMASSNDGRRLRPAPVDLELSNLPTIVQCRRDAVPSRTRLPFNPDS